MPQEYKWYVGWNHPNRAPDPWCVLEYDTLTAAVDAYLRVVGDNATNNRALTDEQRRIARDWLAAIRDDREWVTQRAEAMRGGSFFLGRKIIWLAKLPV